MIGTIANTQKLNARVISGSRQSAYDITFVGSWTFDAYGATGNGTNTYWYINYDHYAVGQIYDSHFGTYQTVAGSTAAYDISVAESANTPGTVFVAMTANADQSGNGIYDYDMTTISYFTCYEPIQNMMSFEDPNNGRNNYIQNAGSEFGAGGIDPNLSKNTNIYGGVDKANGIYTNRGFGFITFGTFLSLGEMEDYQKVQNRFETSMSRNIY